MTLERISFKKGREHAPRISKPYIAGRYSKRYWSELWQYGMQKAAAVIAVINPDISVSPILYDIVKSAFYEGYLFHKGTRYHCDGAWEKSNTLKNILPLLAPAEISETTPYEDALALQQVKRNEKEGYLGVEGTKKFLADIIHQD